LEVRPGEDHPIESLTRHLARYGFKRTDLVYEVGDFAVRGGVVDVFPPGEDAPVRLDLFGDTVESIRWFDAQSQRSEDTLDSIRILPLYLFPGGAEDAALLAEMLTENLGSDLGAHEAEVIEGLRNRGEFPGWENYHPLLASKTVALTDVLPSPLTLAIDPPALEAEVAHHAERLEGDYASRVEHGRLAGPPEALEQPAPVGAEALDIAVVQRR